MCTTVDPHAASDGPAWIGIQGPGCAEVFAADALAARGESLVRVREVQRGHADRDHRSLGDDRLAVPAEHVRPVGGLAAQLEPVALAALAQRPCGAPRHRSRTRRSR